MRPTLLSFGLVFSLIPLFFDSAGAAEAPSTRPVTLQDCIQMALERNLDLQIQRYSPMFSGNDLKIAYAGYEPNFNISGQHDFNLKGGSLDANKLVTPSSESDDNSFSSSIDGVVPYTGMKYTAFVDKLAETYGQSGKFVTVGNVITNGMVIMTNFSTNLVSTPFDSSQGRVGLTLTQPLLKNFLFDTPRFNISVAKNRLKYSETQLQLQAINTITAVEVAYYDLIFAGESVKVQEKALQLAEQLLKENKKRVEVGALAPLDEKQAESQAASRRSDLQTALNVLGNAQNTLKTLISDDFPSVHPVSFEPSETLMPVVQDLDLQESWRRGLAMRPDIQAARLNFEQNQIQSRFYRNQMLPELDLFGTYAHGASGATTIEFSDAFDNFARGNRPSYTYGASLSIPLGNTAARTKYQNSKLVIEQAQLMLKKVEQEAMALIDFYVRLARTNFERIESTRQARLYAEAALDAEQKKLENGKSTSFVVLQIQRDLTTARSEEIRALSDYNKSLSQLAQAEGATLERRNIDIQVK